MARAPRAGDRVGAETARAEGLDADLARHAPALLNEDGTPALGLVSGADAQRLLGLVSGAHAQRLEPHASAPSAVPSLVSASSTSSSPPVSLPASPPHVIEQQERGCLHVHALVPVSAAPTCAPTRRGSSRRRGGRRAPACGERRRRGKPNPNCVGNAADTDV